MRYNAADEPLLSNRVVYVLTRIQESWGAQARLACGAKSRWEDAEDQGVGETVLRFLRLLRIGDIGTFAGIVKILFVLVGLDAVKLSESTHR